VKTKSFFYLFIACTLPLMACGLLQAGIATQTAVAGTTIAASWTATPTLTPSSTLTPTPTETEVPTSTPNPCLPENLSAAVKEVDDLQAQFDHLSSLSANVPREQVPDKITEMRSILQTATDQDTPPCLQVLKDHQLKHMNLVIDTLVAFVDGADTQTLNDKIKRAGEEYSQYTLELTRLLGATPTP
jgi:hypothetical protein